MNERKQMTQKQINYTKEQTERLIALYQERGNDSLEEIAQEMGKTLKSVRAKLVREGVYLAPDKSKKNDEDGPSKKELVLELSKLTGKELTGIEGATKGSLAELIEAFQTR
jgi:predicted HTH domain antitoxin